MLWHDHFGCGETQQKAARLQSTLHLLDAEASNKHTVFVDSEREAKEFDAAEHFQTAPALVRRTYNRPRIADLQEKEGVLGAQTPREVPRRWTMHGPGHPLPADMLAMM